MIDYQPNLRSGAKGKYFGAESCSENMLEITTYSSLRLSAANQG